MKIKVSTEINRPLAAVWHWYAEQHVRNHPRWDPEMELEQVTAGPIGLGTMIRRRNRHFENPVEGMMEIVEWDPGRLMATRIRDANMATEGSAAFEPLGPEHTRLTIEADMPGIDQPTADRIRPLMERTAENIRALLEREDGAT
jgi:hypothetical protein